ncbi:MAG: EthD family reductase [Solirubrobacterales bacterium]|nr:EthD family reductase [Solirubrobacterales bacterium]
MHQLVVLYPHPSDPEAFRRYYTETHLPLAAQLPGLRAYRYGFDLAASQGESPYFCIFEAEFDDADAMRASMASEQGQKVTADVPNYAPEGTVVFSYDVVSGR